MSIKTSFIDFWRVYPVYTRDAKNYLQEIRQAESMQQQEDLRQAMIIKLSNCSL